MTDISTLEFPDGTKRLVGVPDPRDISVLEGVMKMRPRFYMTHFERVASGLAACQVAITRAFRKEEHDSEENPPASADHGSGEANTEPSPRMGRIGKE